MSRRAPLPQGQRRRPETGDWEIAAGASGEPVTCHDIPEINPCALSETTGNWLFFSLNLNTDVALSGILNSYPLAVYVKKFDTKMTALGQTETNMPAKILVCILPVSGHQIRQD